MGVQERRNRDLWAVEDSVEELSELAKTANAFVVGSMVQKRERPTRAYLGKGKLEELKSSSIYDSANPTDFLFKILDINL